MTSDRTTAVIAAPTTSSRAQGYWPCGWPRDSLLAAVVRPVRHQLALAGVVDLADERHPPRRPLDGYCRLHARRCAAHCLGDLPIRCLLLDPDHDHRRSLPRPP